MQVLLYSIVLLVTKLVYSQPNLCSSSSTSPCLPCSTSCNTCSSQTQCIDCSNYHFGSVVTGSLVCLSCSSYCLQCTSSTICTQCQDPYVLYNNTCVACEIPNAIKCKNSVSATQCALRFYVGDNYCHDCLLNCKQCSGNSDCSSCVAGYTLNSTVITCGLCPAGCQTCDLRTTSQCTSCFAGYILLGNSCQAISCSLSNCKYCEAGGIKCAQCSFGYYRSNTLGTCMIGSSVLCPNGAIGPYPTDCINSCGSYAYSKTLNNPTRLQCIPYPNIDINSVNYQQYYYYVYNDYNTLVSSYFSANNNIVYDSLSGEYVYDFQQLSWSSLPSYYRIDFWFKFVAGSPGIITLKATTLTPVNTQMENVSYNAAQQDVKTYTTVFLHSNNLQISSNFRIIQLYFRLSVCSAGCDRCLNKELCELCTSPQYMLGYKCVSNCTVYYHLQSTRTCVVSCPIGYYHATLSPSNKVCQPCVSPCVDCINQTSCLSCISNKFLFDYQCLDTCSLGYYGSNQRCQVCISPCKTCTNQTACLSCDQGFWNGTKCTAICPPGYYGNNLTNLCQICHTSCLSCFNISTHCTSCRSSIFLHNSQCISSCPQRYYPFGNSCIPCVSPCYTCKNDSSCVSCSYNFLSNDQCIGDCGIGKYGDLILRQCLSCSSECKTCSSANGCMTCAKGKCLYGVECIADCPNTSWYKLILNASTSNEQCSCKQCNNPCKTCTDSTTCTSCLSGFLYLNLCVNQCPTSYYGNLADSSCTLCNLTFSYCKFCTPSKCITCSSGYFIYEGQCVNQCPTFYYQQTQQCLKCIAPCLECTEFSSCKSCVSPYIKFSINCIIQCPASYIPISGQCILCQSPCLTCFSTANNCTLCMSGYFLNGNRCIQNCSAVVPLFKLYDQPLTSSCSQCMFPCDTCSSQTICLTCKIGYLTSTTGKCKDCSPGTYPNGAICLTCPSACTTCLSQNVCSNCKSGFYLYAHQCTNNVSLCQANGYYATGRVCQPCRAPCQKCTQSAFKCTSCLSGYIFFLPNSCLAECPKGYYRDANSSCMLCSAACSECVTSPTYCLSCNKPYLLQLGRKECATACPDSTYNEGSLCVACRYPCQNCISEIKCNSCVSGTLINQSCISTCPNGQFTNAKSICEACTSPCKECVSIATNCTQCTTNTYLLNNQCLHNCPNGYFSSNQSLQCLQCLSICKQCTDHINCTSCASDKIYYLNPLSNYAQCVLQCPQTFFKQASPLGQSTFVCASCNFECQTCSNITDCQLCKSGKVQYNGKCLSQCPAHMYAFQGVCQTCTQPCYECSDSFTCNSCINSSYLLLGNAQCILGDVCPQGYYLSNNRQCNTQCPIGYYHKRDRTCDSEGCGVDQFKGLNFMCYSQCPTGTIGNNTYFCNSCTQCNGMYFDVSHQVIRDQLSFIIKFTQTPVYKVTTPIVQIQPSIGYEIGSTLPANLFSKILGAQLEYTSGQANYNGSQTLIVKLNPTLSIIQTVFRITFQNSFATFNNPLQNPFKQFTFTGYDLFECISSPLAALGFIFLGLSVIGLITKPEINDFGQNIFLLALLNVHYPCHLADLLEGASLAHLKGLVSLAQSQDAGSGKFSYVATMGLLQNSFQMIVIILIGLTIAGLLYLLKYVLHKKLNYNRVQDQTQQERNNQHINHQVVQKNITENLQNKQSRGRACTIRKEQILVVEKWYYVIYEHLQGMFNDFQIIYLNRWVYFAFTSMSVFTFSQFWVINFRNGIDAFASICAFFLVFLLPIYAVSLVQQHPKYTFLYTRKLVIALSVVVSVDNPIYIVGVMSVCNITAAILIMSYKIQRWKVETRFLSLGEVLQVVLQVLFAVFIMLGEGSHTNAKSRLAWVIVFLILLIIIYYLVFSICQLVLFIILKKSGIDYKQKWIQEQQENQATDKDSESLSDNSMKEHHSDKARKYNTDHKAGVSLLIPINQNKAINDFIAANKELCRNPDYQSNDVADYGASGQMFWTYNDMEEDPKDHKSPPKLLVRCLNQFSDYDQNEKNDDIPESNQYHKE